MKYSKDLGADELLEGLLNRADSLGFIRAKKKTPILQWIDGLITSSGVPFNLKQHQFQRDVLEDESRVIVVRKAAQLGFSEVVTIRCLYGQIMGRYQIGALFLMPSQLDVADFSRARFSPLILNNPQKIGKFIEQTDAASIKRICQSTLYLRGGKSTWNIENLKKSSSQLISVPCDVLIVDEVDHHEQNMLLLAKERLGHSLVRDEFYLGTPSIPGWGISELYEKSDQKIWVIKCKSCNTENHLEGDFPNCLEQLSNGNVVRACRNCHKEIFPHDGYWIAQNPKSETSGYWVSQLNSVFTDLKELLNYYKNPPAAGLQEFYNSRLGVPWIPAENRITPQDVYVNCGPDFMGANSQGPCCAGIDVGAVLHIVIARRLQEKQVEIVYLGRVSDWNELHNLCRNFGVQFVVIDAEPETRQCRSWQQSESFPIFLADYNPNPLTAAIWNEESMTLKIGRTESLDMVHEHLTSPGKLILPSRNSEVDEYAKQCSSICKVLEQDDLGNRTFKYRKTGPADHYAHATGYCLWAATKIPVAKDSYRNRENLKSEIDFDPFAPNYGTRDNYPFD